MKNHTLSGVYAASVTPLRSDGSLDLEGLPEFLSWLANRGAHGALLLGTTGEGPSFAREEREQIFKAAAKVRQQHPDFKLLAGTGTPALEESIALTKAAFDAGFDGAVILPPYYFRGANENGLFDWFSQLIQRAVPADGFVLGYHIPRVSGVPLTMTLLSRLIERFPRQFIGIKDSSGTAEHAEELANYFGSDLFILNGTDRLFTHALNLGVGGCITAMANLVSPELRKVWDAHLENKTAPAAQAALNSARDVWEKFPPAPVLIKLLLAKEFDLPHWAVKLPLKSFNADTEEKALLSWKARGQIA